MIKSPFIGTEALSAGLVSERALRRLYDQAYPNVCAPRGATLTAQERACAAWLWSKRRGIVAGVSAAAVLGAKWIDPAEAAELIHDNRRPPPGIVVRTEKVLPNEIIEHAGMRVTTPARTAFDLGRHIEARLPAVKRLDALANVTGLKRIDVEAIIAVHPGARGIPRLQRTLALMDGGAESPQETVARLVLIDAGLPSPRTQFHVYDEYGQFVARLDMAYDEVKVGIEYDGRAALDRSLCATARYRQTVRADRAWLANHPGQQGPTALPPRHLCRQSREGTALAGLPFVNLTTFSGDLRRQIHK